MTKNKTSQAYLFLIATAVLWALQPAFIKWLTAEMTPLTFTVFRHGIIGASMLFLYYYQDRANFLPQGRDRWYLVGMGASGILINNVVQFTGLQYTTMTNCTLISGTTPAFTALLAALFLRERLPLKAWLGIVLSLAGVIVIISRGDWAVVRNFALNYGDILCVISIIAWAVFALLSVEVMKKHSAIGATGWSSFFGSLLTLLYAVLTGEFCPVALSLPALGSAAYATLLGGIFCVLAWNYGVQKVGASTASVFLNLMPVVGVLGGVVMLGEAVTFAGLAGAALVISGVWLTTHAK